MAGDSKLQEEWTMNHFSQANPKGPRQADVGDLLARVADGIRGLGEGVTIHDITFHSESDEKGDSWPTMTVYYSREGPL